MDFIKRKFGKFFIYFVIFITILYLIQTTEMIVRESYWEFIVFVTPVLIIIGIIYDLIRKNKNLVERVKKRLLSILIANQFFYILISFYVIKVNVISENDILRNALGIVILVTYFSVFYITGKAREKVNILILLVLIILSFPLNSYKYYTVAYKEINAVNEVLNKIRESNNFEDFKRLMSTGDNLEFQKYELFKSMYYEIKIELESGEINWWHYNFYKTVRATQNRNDSILDVYINFINTDAYFLARFRKNEREPYKLEHMGVAWDLIFSYDLNKDGKIDDNDIREIKRIVKERKVKNR